MVETPESEYRSRLERIEAELTAIRERHASLWLGFALSCAATIAALILALSWHSIDRIWCALPIVMVVFIFRELRRNTSQHIRVSRIAEFYRGGLARITGDWKGRGVSGEEFRPAQHLYASDLDLFGKGSVFELLCTARSGVGRATLANWLLCPAEPSVIRERQQAIAELRQRFDLQEHCAAVADFGIGDVYSAAPSDWATTYDTDFPSWAPWLSILLPLCLVALVGVLNLGILSHASRWVVAVVVAEATLAAVLRDRVREVMTFAQTPSYQLSLLRPLMQRLAAERLEAPLLRQLRAGVTAGGTAPLRAIRNLSVICKLLSLRSEEWFALASSFVLWATNLSQLVERWRKKHGGELPVWIDSVGQFEALLCLARYSFENPDHVFPNVSETLETRFSAKDMGHPLLENKSCVRCNIELGRRSSQLYIVSGSNMAGKSTLLRSIGVNSVLALTGAPVRASEFNISPLKIACSIAVTDSFTDGKSRFQAEVERLKSVVGEAERGPTLFLLDEVLGGTNPVDRLCGTRVVCERLLASGAVGLITTHDLALCDIARATPDIITNVHFEEYYEDGEMRFDYCMRPGVLVRTNGLNVMKALGLLEESSTAEA